jgi:hypothetical protein
MGRFALPARVTVVRFPEHFYCVLFNDSVTLAPADQAAFGPRKGLNLPASSGIFCLLSVGKRGRPANLKEGVA